MATHPFSAAGAGFLYRDESLEARQASPKKAVSRHIAFASDEDEWLDSEVFGGFAGSVLFKAPDEEKGRKFKRVPSVDAAPPVPHARSASALGSAHDLGAAFFLDGADPLAGSCMPRKHRSRESTQESLLLAPGTAVREQAWQTWVDEAVSESNGQLDLSGKGIREIPHNIGDLSNLTAPMSLDTDRSFARGAPLQPRRGFERTASAPAFSSRPREGSLPKRVFSRAQSGSLALGTGATAATIQLFLANNSIKARSISNVLFTLTNLTVLSLRSNELDTLPPGIGLLVNLVELNVASNQLKHLPAEILKLQKLQTLALHPNPFLPPPPPPARAVQEPNSDGPQKEPEEDEKDAVAEGRLLGALETLFRTPSLLETATRVLLRPEPGTSKALIQEEDKSFIASLPTALSEQFSTTLYPKDFSKYASPSTGKQVHHARSHVCYSPSHPGSELPFVAHAVQRLEWIDQEVLTLAGRIPRTDEGESRSARTIPVLHRGCSARCLDWLEQQ